MKDLECSRVVFTQCSRKCSGPSDANASVGGGVSRYDYLVTRRFGSSKRRVHPRNATRALNPMQINPWANT
eukprot:5009514-Heterocapsa_arctica.AAC.1